MKRREKLTKRLDRDLAAPMFVLSLLVLALFASLIYLNDLDRDANLVWWCLLGLAILYPLFWLETAVHIFAGSRFMNQHFWFCLLPITRVGARDHETGQAIWLPKSKWREVNRTLERLLARRFSIPMILVALMVLPIIVMEFFYKDFVDSHPLWHVAMSVAEAFIWAAFTFEFILMIRVVKYPLNYVRKHWIDLAIILLPMLAFLRTLRLASIGRLNQLSRTARVFRLRGLGMRMWRGFVALEIIEMLLSRNPERRLEKLEGQLEDRMEEISFLEKDINRLRQRVEKRRQEGIVADDPVQGPSENESDENEDDPNSIRRSA